LVVVEAVALLQVLQQPLLVGRAELATFIEVA
jgi:hypothetical protein